MPRKIIFSWRQETGHLALILELIIYKPNVPLLGWIALPDAQYASQTVDLAGPGSNQAYMFLDWHHPAALEHHHLRVHYNDVIMGTIASQITSLAIVYSIVYSEADQRKHQSSASLAFVWGFHRGPVNSPHKWPVTRKIFPFDDVIMGCSRNSPVWNNPVCQYFMHPWDYTYRFKMNVLASSLELCTFTSYLHCISAFSVSCKSFG